MNRSYVRNLDTYASSKYFREWGGLETGIPLDKKKKKMNPFVLQLLVRVTLSYASGMVVNTLTAYRQRECARGMRTADVAKAINCNVRTVRRLRQDGQLIILVVADHV
jgi:hypothetical protein